MEAIGPLHGLHVGERNKTSLGQRGGGGVSAHGHISGLKPFLISKLISNLQITLNSTQI
jgi:hypothetical protein